MHFYYIPTSLTTFFDHFEILVDDEPFVKVKRSFKIGVETITSFGFDKNIDDHWIHKGDHPQPIPDEQTRSSPPQDTSSALLDDIMHEIRNL